MAELPYDPNDPQSILAYAEKLIGHNLRTAAAEQIAQSRRRGKGEFGSLLEECYFQYEPNNRPEPDFASAGVELKATPIKWQSKTLVPKERLVLGMIDYMTIDAETWETSSFLHKNSLLLLVFYVWSPESEVLDYPVRIVKLFEFPPEDLEIIRRDWETIRAKVVAGCAHEISEGDTYYLGACTKGAKGSDRRPQPNSDLPAKPRAFSLKQSYMRYVVADALAGSLGARAKLAPKPAVSIADARALRTDSFETLVAKHFEGYIGMTADAIAAKLEMRINRNAKNFYAVLTKRMLGVAPDATILEFDKADVQVKTIRLLPSGRPKEDVPFRAFDYCDLVEREWDDSDLRSDLSKRFLFVIYQLDAAGVPTLLGIRFWSMPVSDIEGPARDCYRETVTRVREDRAEYLPKKSENRCCHVRPHGRDSRDTVATPSGRLVCRKSFWLNGTYIRDELNL
jgi:DNA mismatch repair protein MutH